MTDQLRLFRPIQAVLAFRIKACLNGFDFLSGKSPTKVGQSVQEQRKSCMEVWQKVDQLPFNKLTCNSTLSKLQTCSDGPSICLTNFLNGKVGQKSKLFKQALRCQW